MHKLINHIGIILLLILTSHTIYGQQLEGTLYEINEDEKKQVLAGATIYWQNTSIGSISDSHGRFIIPRKNQERHLIISFIGYQSDTVLIDKDQTILELILQKGKELSGVTITSNESTYISSRPILSQRITTEGLRKAACCNLSESFESTISVDVSYSDAISGAKQIQMLGLAGIYTQIMLENTPYIRGLAAPFGLMYIPGSWMEAINISKGTASVINGYESITGQIDVNYKTRNE